MRHRQLDTDGNFNTVFVIKCNTDHKMNQDYGSTKNYNVKYIYFFIFFQTEIDHKR